MKVNKLKMLLVTALWITCLCIFSSLKTADQRIGLNHTIGIFKEGTAGFGQSLFELQAAVSVLNSQDTRTIANARAALTKSRLAYKRIEFFMDYFFESSGLIYNRPAKVEVDEPYMEYQEPSGFQVIEALLFDEDPAGHRKALLEQAELLISSAADLNSLLYSFDGKDEEILESVRLELVKVITLGITGYDAPELKTGISEAYQSIDIIKKVLTPYLSSAENTDGKLSLSLSSTLAYLKVHTNFDQFDRMEFLTIYALPLQEKLGNFIRERGLEANYKSILNYKASHIFSPDALPASAFNDVSAADLGTGKHADEMKVTLGKRLFAEKILSGNLKRSCISCHNPAKYFSDGLKTSLAFNEESFVKRNAPTLLYAGFQYAQFWDGRVKTLAGQIKDVIANPSEMNGEHKVIVASLKKNAGYQIAFQQSFPAAADPLNMNNLAEALAAYLSTLSPRNSAFDRYMAGDRSAMNKQQLNGFNLFMGKGQCGSCHFAPLFNGLIPPLYKRTEFEVLGTPANADFDRLVSDQDAGRFGFFPISYYQGAFKTPTVRNTAKTAPYMHNGAFEDLEKVVEFYNQGGGAGLRLEVPGQTLSAKPLNLSKKEVQEIVAFMESLTDNLNTVSNTLPQVR